MKDSPAPCSGRPRPRRLSEGAVLPKMRDGFYSQNGRTNLGKLLLYEYHPHVTTGKLEREMNSNLGLLSQVSQDNPTAD